MRFSDHYDIFSTKRVPSGGVRLGAGAFREIPVSSLLIGTGVVWECGREVWKWLNP